MIFGYDELKKYVSEDFECFYKMGFDAEQILHSVLNEYKHGEGFCLTENICIHIFLALNYTEKRLNVNVLKQELKQLITKDALREIKNELGCEYTKYISDLEIIRNCT